MARAGSKGVPGKNVRPLLGRPLIMYTIDEAKASQYIDRIVVSTDDEFAMQLALESGCDVILRPPELAQDNTPSLDALRHAVGEIETRLGRECSIVVELRVTNPFKTVEDIDGAVEKLQILAADSVIGMTVLEDHHPARVKKLVNGKIVDFCVPEPQHGQRRLLEPKAYIRNGSIYCVRRGSLMGPNGRLFGHENSRPWLMPPERSVNIDTEVDFILAEALMRQRWA